MTHHVVAVVSIEGNLAPVPEILQPLLLHSSRYVLGAGTPEGHNRIRSRCTISASAALTAAAFSCGGHKSNRQGHGMILPGGQ